MKKQSLLFFFILLGFFLLGCGSDTSTTSGWETAPLESIYDDTPLEQDPEIRTGVLDNGLTYYALSNDSPGGNFEVRLVITAGGLAQEDKDSGLAHFVEHMVFAGTENFPNGIFEELAPYGMNVGTHLNAWTSCDLTTYTFSAKSEEVLEVALQALDDIATSAILPEERVPIERDIIIEEFGYGESLDGTTSKLFQDMYIEGTPYEECNVIGTLDGINSVTSQDLTDYYNTWYRPDLMAVILVGDLPVAQLEELIITHFEDNPSISGPDAVTGTALEQSTGTKVRTFSHPDINSFVSVDFELPQLSSPGSIGQDYELFLQWLIYYLIDSHLSSRVADGDANFSEPWQDFWSETENLSFFGWGFLSENPVDELKAFLKEFRYLEENGFSENDLSQALASLSSWNEVNLLQKQTYQDYEYADDLVFSFAVGVPVENEEETAERWSTWINEVSLEDANAYFKWLMSETAPQVIVLTSDPENTPEISSLETAISDVDEESLEGMSRPTTYVVPERLMEPPLQASGVVNSTFHGPLAFEDYDITEINYGNGITVLHVYSPVVAGEVSLRACSLGGFAKLDSPVTGQSALVDFVTNAVDKSGVGSHSSREIKLYKEEKNISLQSWIGEFMQCQIAVAPAASLDSVLQLIHLRYTSPTVDDQEFDQVQIELDAFLQNQADPYWASAAAMNAMIYGDEEYFGIFPSPSQIDSFTPQKALEIYEDLFNNTSGLVVVITGDIPLDTVEELSETYIASLPKENPEIIIDQPLLPSGILTEYVSSGENQASSGFDIGFQTFVPRAGQKAPGWVDLFFAESHGTFIVAVLEDRLFERLRQELGITYSAATISVRTQFMLEPRIYTEINVDVPIESIPLAHQIVLEEIESLRTVPISGEEFASFQQSIVRETDYISNRIILDDLIDWKLLSREEWPLSQSDRNYVASELIDPESLRFWAFEFFPEEHRTEVFRCASERSSSSQNNTEQRCFGINAP